MRAKPGAVRKEKRAVAKEISREELKAKMHRGDFVPVHALSRRHYRSTADRCRAYSHAAVAAAHEGHGGKTVSTHDHHGHGEYATMFRGRFWVSLVLSVPMVLYSEMVQMWLGFSVLRFPGSGWVAPVLGTFIFGWGSWPSLKGGIEEALEEARDRRPRMMLLISMAFMASATTALGAFDLAFWWELALLVTIVLLGHWMEMRAVGQTSGRSRRWQRSCPTRPRG